MSLKYAILGFLEMSPLSGYDIKKMFDASVQFYWPATHSQIYRTLDQILGEGLVTQEIVYQTGSPNKKVYQITEEGKRDLRAWLTTSQELPTIRHKLLVQVGLADQLSNEEIISLLRDYVAEINVRLKKYRDQEQMSVVSNYARTERERFLWHTVLLNGINLYEAELKWATEAIQGLQQFE